MQMETLRDLFIENLQELRSAEEQLIEALPKFAEAAYAPELRSAFQENLKQTKVHASRLEEILGSLGEIPGDGLCEGVESLIKMGNDLVEDGLDPRLLDAALICAAQRIEHYEIATYGTLRNYANALSEQNAEALLQKTLDEEKGADRALSALADVINSQATGEDSCTHPRHKPDETAHRPGSETHVTANRERPQLNVGVYKKW